jgi:hypothetical protein
LIAVQSSIVCELLLSFLNLLNVLQIFGWVKILCSLRGMAIPFA